ncbi:hypothetical protein OIV83_002949 [Microbotryomycetes sp. JL201]|nr:hypothetical protein OIV83_002949 [Microbotryomycetes sp. JL201]
MGLFGRSSTFNATVTVHELSQVPLVAAKFRVKWKFKGATSVAQHGSGTTSEAGGGAESDDSDAPASATRRLLHPKAAAVFGRQASGEHQSSSLRRSLSPLVTTMASDGTGHPMTSTSSPDDYANASGSRYARNLSASPPQHDSATSTAAERTPNPNKTPSASHSSTFAFTSPFGSGSDTVYSNTSSVNPSPAQGNTPDDSPASNMGRRRGGADLSRMPPPQAVHHSRAEPKGSTTLIPLRNHTCTFQREVHCPVAIPVKAVAGTQHKYQLQSSVVKLSVRQEVMGDDGAKTETKAGDVWLDLSQFATPAGAKRSEPRARRYLLKESKTNATLRVTVTMEFLSGEADFVAPPLRSGQVNTGTKSSVASSASSTFSKSSTSLVSKNKARPKSSSSSVSMSRTTSSSSMSVNSERSSHSSSHASGKTRGWHPTPGGAGQLFSTSPSPGLLGGSNEHGRGAADIIDTIFNQGLVRQSSWDSRPSTPSRALQHHSNNQTLGGDALVFSVGNTPQSSEPRAPFNSTGKSKTSRWQGLRHASTPPISSSSSKPFEGPSAFRNFDSQASSRSSSLRFDSSASTSPDRPTFVRRTSLSSTSSSPQNYQSKNLSVRWTDDRKLVTKTSASNLRDDYQRQTRSSSPNVDMTSLSLEHDRPVARKDYASRHVPARADTNNDDDQVDHADSGRDRDERPPHIDRRLTLKPSAGSLKPPAQQHQYHQSSASAASSRTTPKPTPVTPKGQVEWAKSWG